MLYCHFNKIIKGPGTIVSSHQHWSRNMFEMFVIQHTSVWPNFILIGLRIGLKRNKQKCNFNYVAMLMMSQILKSVNSTKTQKSRYLEKETLFLLQIKESIKCASKATLPQKNIFVAEVTFKVLKNKCISRWVDWENLIYVRWNSIQNCSKSENGDW